MESKDTGVFNLYYFIFNYGKYHNNKVNQLLHFVFIPTIQFTLLVIMCHYFPEIAMPEPLHAVSKHLNIVTALFVLLANIAYFRVDLTTALVYLVWSSAQLFFSQYLYANKESYTLTLGEEKFSLLYWSTVLHIVSWIAQFYGHGVHEGRAPALMDNVAFMGLAPFFVSFEFLHYGFGYREGPEMQKVRAAIANDIKAYRAGRQKTK
jgi:uncharacterized membrane protein YGL010W